MRECKVPWQGKEAGGDPAPPTSFLLAPLDSRFVHFPRNARDTPGTDRPTPLLDRSHTIVTKAGALSKSNRIYRIGPCQFRYSCPLLFGVWVLVHISGGFGIITIFNVTPGYHVMSLKHRTLAGYKGLRRARHSGRRVGQKDLGMGGLFSFGRRQLSLPLPITLY